MLKVGDICPIFFNPLKYGIDKKYFQRFYISDKIHVQVIATDGDIPEAYLNNLCTGDILPISFLSFQINENTKAYYFTLTNLSDSFYSITVLGKESEPFEVTSSNSILEDTALIRCSHSDNSSSFADNIFWTEDSQLFIEFRLEGGFREDGIQPQVSSESFRDTRQEVIHLYAAPYTIYNFTIGSAMGVPSWFILLINKMLCLDNFEINGIKYVRSEESTPEIEAVSEFVQLFRSSVSLETQINDIAGIGSKPEPGDVGDSIPVKTSNVQDGEILRYDKERGVWTNTNTLNP